MMDKINQMAFATTNARYTSIRMHFRNAIGSLVGAYYAITNFNEGYGPYSKDDILAECYVVANDLEMTDRAIEEWIESSRESNLVSIVESMGTNFPEERIDALIRLNIELFTKGEELFMKEWKEIRRLFLYEWESFKVVQYDLEKMEVMGNA